MVKTGNLEFQVIDGATAKGIAGVLVIQNPEKEGTKYTTDANGKVLIKNVPVGVLVSMGYVKSGYATSRSQAYAYDGMTSNYVIPMSIGGPHFVGVGQASPNMTKQVVGSVPVVATKVAVPAKPAVQVPKTQ